MLLLSAQAPASAAALSEAEANLVRAQAESEAERRSSMDQVTESLAIAHANLKKLEEERAEQTQVAVEEILGQHGSDGTKLGEMTSVLLKTDANRANQLLSACAAAGNERGVRQSLRYNPSVDAKWHALYQAGLQERVGCAAILSHSLGKQSGQVLLDAMVRDGAPDSDCARVAGTMRLARLVN